MAESEELAGVTASLLALAVSMLVVYGKADEVRELAEELMSAMAENASEQLYGHVASAEPLFRQLLALAVKLHAKRE